VSWIIVEYSVLRPTAGRVGIAWSYAVVILETDRLILRDHEARDLDGYCRMEQDPDVRRYAGGRPRSRDEAERVFWERAMAPDRSVMGVWAADLKPDEIYVGRCGIYPEMQGDREIPGEGVLSFYIDSAYWGRGIATEAGRACVAFGFQDLGLSRIVATVQNGNDASARVLEKLGFRLEWTEAGKNRTFLHFELRRPASSDQPSILAR